MNSPNPAVPAEVRFPDLQGNPRWDYVIDRDSTTWDAVEVKSLVIPEFLREMKGWPGIWEDVEGTLRGRITGEFLVLGWPEWFPKQNQRHGLVQAIADAVIELLADAPIESTEDLGPSIIVGFPDWPTGHVAAESYRAVYDMETGMPVSVPPWELNVFKSNSTNPVVRFELGSSRTFMTFPRVDLDDVLNDLIKANGQLALARARGARGTAILLDDHKGTDPSQVAIELGSLHPSTISHVDRIYLVNGAQDQIVSVWERSITEVDPPHN